VTAENAQLGAHVQLLESELEAVRATSGDSAENSPHGPPTQPLDEYPDPGTTPMALPPEHAHESSGPPVTPT
jgi:hypothetical protein